MAGIADLFGKGGYIEQLVLWNVMGQVLSALLAPGLETLQQDVSAKHPVVPIDPGTLADLAARGIWTPEHASGEAARSGLNTSRFAALLDMRTVRLSPADLATAVLRSYLTAGEAEAIARPQGYDAAMMRVLTDLAGDAPGPDQLVQALRRGIVPRSGTGPESVSYQQGIAETRLHDKWGEVLEKLSVQLLSPADAASAVVRNFLTDAAGQHIAALSGVPADTFATLVHLSADAPGPQQLAEALRRDLIPATGTGAGSTSFAQGIAEGRLADKWADVIKGLAVLWPTPTDALDAALKGQITAQEGKTLYQRLGGDLEFYDWLLATIGDSPTPLEAAVLAARGIIAEHGTGPGVLSYDQAVKESRYRDKWGPAYRRLAEHIPPPSTIVTLLAHKNITELAAHELLLQNDMAPDLAAAYIADAEYEAISDYRGLTQSAVIDLYIAHIVNRDQAVQLLGVLHVAERAAGLLLDYADMRYVIDSINRSVQRIAQLFTSRKIGIDTARNALLELGLSPTAADDLINDLELQAAANVKTLTEAQIVDAVYYDIIGVDEGLNDLQALGWTPYDAWVVLSVKVKGPIPGKPKRIAAAPIGAVIPGVT